MRLFTPGPTNVPSDVLSILGQDVIHHRSAPFAVQMKRMVDNLKTIFHSSGEIIILTSSGTGGLEAGLSNLFNPGDKVVIISNGFFGERLVAIATQLKLNSIVVEAPWGTSVSIAKVQEAIESDSSIVGLVTAHCDTSTGVLNDIQALGQLAHQHHLLYMVDSVSGLPLNPLDFDGYHIDCAVAASQKGFLMPPGLAFISLSKRAIDQINKVTQGRYYFDLRKHLTYLHDNYQTPFTPNISLTLAGAYALDKMLQKGLKTIQDQAHQMRDYIHPRLVDLGFRPLVSPLDWGVSVVTYWTPSGIDSRLLRTYLMEQHNILIEGGLGASRNELIRIGFMSDLTLEDASDLIQGIKLFLNGGSK